MTFTVESSPLIVRRCLQIFEKEWPQIFAAREIRRDDAEQAPAPLARLRLVVGRLLHQLTVHLVSQAFEFMAVLKIQDRGQKMMAKTVSVSYSSSSIERGMGRRRE